jgi:NAD(P)-dependent dehydrogenase (short-subunit alcohol dehydrogenase family)
VVATARDEGSLESLRDEHPQLVATHQLDVTDSGSIDAACAFAVEQFGRIDVLVNNAGRGFLGPFEETGDDDLRRVFDTNVFGTAALTRAVLATMRPARRGHIIFVTSLGAMLAPPFVAAYAASKAAADRLAEALAAEVRPFGIRVSCIMPGLFRTNFRHRGIEIATSTLSDYSDAYGGLTNSVAQDYPPTAGDPEDVADAILQVVDAGDDAPLRLLLGADALAAAEATAARSKKEIDAWAHVSRAGGEGADNLTPYLGDPNKSEEQT